MKESFLLSQYLSLAILLPIASSRVYFTEHPVDVTVNEGASMVSIHCQIANLKRASQVVAFKRGPRVISDDAIVRDDVSSRYKIQLSIHSGTMQRRYSLSIDSPTRNDTGSYRCIVCGRNASTPGCDDGQILASSDKAKLTVNFSPADFYPICTPPAVSVLNSSVLELVEGESVNLSCYSEIASPPVELVWFKNDVEVKLTDQVKTSDENGIRYSRLKVTPSKKDNDTVFTCAIITSESHNDLAKNCSLSPLLITPQRPGNSTPDSNHGDDRTSIIIIVVLAVIILVLLVAIAVAVFLKRKNSDEFSDRGIGYQPAQTTDTGETEGNVKIESKT